MELKSLNQPVDVNNIDFRVQSITKDGWATILAYKDARYDMNMLDDVCGPGNWQRDHKIIDGNLYCGIGIFINDQWVWKWDVGTESQTEKEKGQASDSFKRAGFNWGIGRELYDFPYIGVQLNDAEFYTKQVGAKTIGVATSKLRLTSWTWYVERDDKGKISYLACKDQNKKVRFQHGTYAKMKKELDK